MNSMKEKYCFKSSSLNETRGINALKNLKYFSDNNGACEMSEMNKGRFKEVFPSQNMQRKTHANVFKVPNLGSLPVKQTIPKNIKISPKRVQPGSAGNDLKAKQSKVSLIPRPSFINSSKSLHCSRTTQLNARKELIKKMVFLAECTLKENQMNKSTPVKVLAGLTPKKTPRSGSYFKLPEFKKKFPKLEEIKSPIEDLIKKEMFSYSAKSLNEKTSLKFCENIKNFDSDLNNKDVTADVENSSDIQTRLSQILCHCRVYSKEVTHVHERIKTLDEAFENRLDEIPEYKVYNEFCSYQLKKEDLYKDLKIIDEEFRNSVTTEMNVSNKLKIFLKKREELLGKQKNLLKDFEQVVQTTLDKYNKEETKSENTEEKIIEITPKLRRSLRLSNILRKNENSPITKKLKKLDTKSRKIKKKD